MSDIKFIMAQVFMAGLFPTGLLCASAANKQAVSANNNVEGEEWFVPFTDNGIFDRYDRVIQTTAPTTDAIRAVRLRDPESGQTQWVLGTLADWVDRVNACCGNTPAMPDVVIPDVFAEEMPCPVIDCSPVAATYSYVDVFPLPLLAGQAFLLAGSANGVPFTPAASALGYATPAAALAFAQASWGAYGTWTLSADGDGLQLTSTTATSGSIKITVKPAP